jgi:hypothetical protein
MAIADDEAIVKTEKAVRAKAAAKSGTSAAAATRAKRTKLILLEQRTDIRLIESSAWYEAFVLARKFLVKQQLEHTLAATEAEFKDFTSFPSVTSESQSSEHIDALVQYSDSPPPAQRMSRAVPEESDVKGGQQGDGAERATLPQDLHSSSAQGESDD